MAGDRPTIELSLEDVCRDGEDLLLPGRQQRITVEEVVVQDPVRVEERVQVASLTVLSGLAREWWGRGYVRSGVESFVPYDTHSYGQRVVRTAVAHSTNKL